MIISSHLHNAFIEEKYMTLFKINCLPFLPHVDSEDKSNNNDDLTTIAALAATSLLPGGGGGEKRKRGRPTKQLSTNKPDDTKTPNYKKISNPCGTTSLLALNTPPTNIEYAGLTRFEIPFETEEKSKESSADDVKLDDLGTNIEGTTTVSPNKQEPKISISEANNNKEGISKK